MAENKITPQLEYEALNAFYFAHNVEPFRTIAEKIVSKYFEVNAVTLLVDDIASSLEDAYELGVKRGPLIPPPRPK